MEYKTVTIGSLIQRKRLKAKNYKGSAQVYAVTNNRGFVKSEDLHDFQIHSEDTSNYSIVETNDFAYNPSRLNIGSIAYYQNEEAGMISPMYVVFSIDKNLVTPEYLFLLIRSSYVMQRIEGLKEEGARFRFDFKRWENIEVKLPSLSDQKKIVDILNSFSSLASNLEIELASRQKQYEYYRNELLNFDKNDESIEWKSLGDLCTSISSGKSTSREIEGKYPVYGSTGIIAYSESYNYSIANILVARVGANAGYVHMAEGFYDVTDNTLVLSMKDQDLIDYIYYSLIDHNISQYAKGGGQPLVTGKDLKAIIIPIPPKQRRREIVSILDTFESLISNIKQELDARKKQYEYYREQLLTFRPSPALP